jgi:hypothetical protein
MDKLTNAFEEQCIHSHGDPVPLRVRDAATMLFWLPEVLRWAHAGETTSVARWAHAFECLQLVLAWVANQMSAFDWPTADQVMLQYKLLMRRWAGLLRDTKIASKACIPNPGLAAGSSFAWTYWWQASHCDSRVSSPGLEAAFALWHFVGMFGVSEAAAEGVASHLKRFGPRALSSLGTDRIVEKTLLKMSGVNGRGADDLLILRAWGEFFGSIERISFLYKNPERERLFPLGGGSMVIHRHLKRSRQPRRWSAAALRTLPYRESHLRTAKRWLGYLSRGA